MAQYKIGKGQVKIGSVFHGPGETVELDPADVKLMDPKGAWLVPVVKDAPPPKKDGSK